MKQVLRKILRKDGTRNVGRWRHVEKRKVVEPAAIGMCGTVREDLE